MFSKLCSVAGFCQATMVAITSAGGSHFVIVVFASGVIIHFTL